MVIFFYSRMMCDIVNPELFFGQPNKMFYCILIGLRAMSIVAMSVFENGTATFVG